MGHLTRIASALVVTSFGVNAHAAESGTADATSGADTTSGADAHGSVLTTEALGSGNVGMAIGGGIAVLLPLFSLEVGVGLPHGVDLIGRFETVIGVFHYPGIGVRWQPFEMGSWRAGTKLLVNYSFFGIKTDQVNFTSTFYFTGEFGVSGPVSDTSELGFGLGGELDMFTVDVVDDQSEVVGGVRWDATVLRTVFVTALSDDIDGFAQLRARIPTETFEFEAQEFYVIPMIDIGGVWTF
jgi:hypothetical protein